MSRLIIYVSGKPLLHGHKRREFLWSPAHKCYLYGGKEIEAAEFNAIYEKAMRTNADMNPRVLVTNADASAAPIAPVATIAAHEITTEEAEAVLARLAPERLKKKTGPKPRVLEVA